MKRTKPTPTNNASLQNRRIVPEEDPGISADKLHQFVVMGIYADLTLVFKRGSFTELPWTYPDYGDPETIGYFNDIRKTYMEQLKEMRRLD